MTLNKTKRKKTQIIEGTSDQLDSMLKIYAKTP